MYMTRQSGHRRLVLTMSGCLLMAWGNAFAQAPPNDSCENATVIPSSAPDPVFTDMVDTTTATFDANDPLMSCNTAAGDGNNTVWYKWTPAASGIVNVTTEGSTTPGGGALDTVHAVYVGDSCGNLVEAVCTDVGFNDDMIINVPEGLDLYFKVGEFNGGTGGGNLVFSVQGPPEPEQFIIESARDGTSAPLIDIVGPATTAVAAGSSADVARNLSILEVPNLSGSEAGVATVEAEGHSGSMVPGRKGRKRGRPGMLNSFEGGENGDNANVLGTLIAPPDTIGEAGRHHYVQMFNLLTEIFDKEGNTVLGPFPTSAFFTGLGGACEFENAGDPIVLYDEQYDRWMVSQFQGFGGFNDFALCIAVSETGDPTGIYHQYEFNFNAIGFPDYPKFGFATDAINVMANMFVPFQGAGIGVIDRQEAMQPGPATLIFFVLGPTEFGFVPGDNDGPRFNNTKPTFFTNNFTSGQFIDVWEIEPDYDTPENSTASEVETLQVAPFDTDLCPASRETCIPQPGSGTGTFPENITFLEAISDRMMHRAQMRDYGNRKVAMLNHTVDADGSGTAGIRWYEFTNNRDRGWMVRRQNTYSPDSDNRWMGSIALTKNGHTCLGYSISSFDTYASIGIAGRRGRGNSMNVEEVIAFDGNVAANVQRQTGRWGDYSAISVDPVNDSCWFTTEYAKPNIFIGERFGWGTQIINFIIGPASGGGGSLR